MPHRALKEELTCPICMELFRHPRRLPCGHSYCHMCIKSMLDRRVQETGSNLNYLGPLICPECREEVSIDFIRGIEGIPLDFKLSKLVDLFHFMKKNDNDSDSSEELQPDSSAVPCAVSRDPCASETPGTTETLSSVPVTSSYPIPTYLQPSESYPLHDSSHLSAAGSAANQLSSQRPILGTVSSVANPQWQSTSTISVSAFNSLPFVTNSTENLSATGSFRHDIISDPHITGFVPVTGIENPSTLPQGVINLCLDAERSTRALSEAQSPDAKPNVSASSCFLHQVSTEDILDLGSDFGAVGGIESSRSESDRNLQISHNCSPFSGSNGLVACVRGQRDCCENRRQSQVRRDKQPELGVAGAPELREWLSGNRLSPGQVRDLSHSSLSLPAEIDEETQYPRDRLPELNGSIPDTTERFSRAQSVPLEARDRGTDVGPVGLTTGDSEQQSSRRRTVKPHRANKSSRFLDLDTSLDSDDDVSQQVRRSTGKKKRWLMTRFLRSVLFSDSSSTDYSTNSSDNDEVKPTVAVRTLKQGKSSSACSSSVSHKAGASLNSSQSHESPAASARAGTVERQTRKGRVQPNACAVPKWSGKGNRRFPTDFSEPFPETGDGSCSIDSNTLPKKVERQLNVNPTLAGSPTRPKEIYTSEAFTQNQNNVPSSTSSSRPFSVDQSGAGSTKSTIPKALSETDVRREFQNIAPYLQSIGHLPFAHAEIEPYQSLYDNLTRHSTLAQDRRGPLIGHSNTIGTNPAAPGSKKRSGHSNLLVRDCNFNPRSQQGNAGIETEGGGGEEKTFYDNENSDSAGFDNHATFSPMSCGRRVFLRNSVTDIESLKTGYEQERNENNSTNSRTESSIYRVCPFMGELRLGAHSLTDLTSYAINDLNARQGQGEVFSPAEHGGRAECGDNFTSSYDNLTSLHVSDSSKSLETGTPYRLSNTERKVMAQQGSNDNSCVYCTQRSRASADGAISDRNFSAENTSHCLNAHCPLGFDARLDENLEFVENYFDNSSSHLIISGSSPGQNLAAGEDAGARDETSHNERRGNETVEGVATAAVAAASCTTAECSPTTRADMARKKEAAESPHLAENSREKSANSSSGNDDKALEDEEDDIEGSHSGTSMLQNKKKPRSRLKKFLTSLLSLSSSSDDDEEQYDNKTSSSKSSDW